MATIGIFDSGVGGLSVLKEIRRLLPHEHYVYYADNAHCPYGEKTAEYICARADFVTELLLGKGAQVIVIACNTATAAAIAHLRANYPVPFIGMEPAVKAAARRTKSGVVGVLATAGTLKATKYQHTKERYAGDIQVVEGIGEGFVERVERLELDGPATESAVRKSLQPLLDAGADVIVLGCTHYPFLRPVIARIGGPDLCIVDPAPAVARHLADVLATERIPLEDESASGSLELLSSGPGESLARVAASIEA